MIGDKKVVVVLPAFNAAKTLERTIDAIPANVVDEIVLVDDASTDQTLEHATRIGIRNIHAHDRNRGYGANQKTCYRLALDLGADIVVMLHPDYQYDPRLIPSMCTAIASEVFDVVLGSRILGGGALRGGMPLYKYIANRALTFVQNVTTGAKLSEYHTGYRAFSRKVLQQVPFHRLADSHIFDNEILSEILLAGFSIGEISCPTHYFAEASSLSFSKSFRYGLGVLRVSLNHLVKRTFAQKS